MLTSRDTSTFQIAFDMHELQPSKMLCPIKCVFTEEASHLKSEFEPHEFEIRAINDISVSLNLN